MFSLFTFYVTLFFFTSGSFGNNTSSKLEVYDILLKPFGVRLSPDSDKIFSTAWSSLNCTGHLQELHACNNTLLNFLNNTDSNEEKAVNSLMDTCGSGRYKCLQQQVFKSSVLRGWFKKLKVALHQMCWDQCWRISLAVEKDCIHSNERTLHRSIQFSHEVLEAFCHEPQPLTSGELASYCTDYFVEGLFSQDHNKEELECDVRKAIEDKRCYSSCYQEISDFYLSLGTCVSVVTDIMKKYHISPSLNTFGVIVQNSTVVCGKNQPKSLTKPTRSSATSTSGQNQTTSIQSTAAGSSSLSGKLVAAIVVAVLVFGIAGLVSCRYAYQRFINRPKFRFEDYGYSHLQMMQDSEDFYRNNFDDDDDHGLLDL